MSDIKFVIPEEQNTIIKVVGVGGGGCNAVNHMHKQGIVGVKFVVCNTDAQALNQSEVPVKVQLGPDLTGGRGAGAKPDVGKEATHESLDELKDVIGEDTQMLFVTAGMGGGTGTGGAPVIAQKAREMGVLTVGIVTTPFDFEGPIRMKNAQEGIEEIRQYVDTLVVINNNRVSELYASSTFTEAFSHADDVLVNAAKSIAEIITVTGVMNVDFADVCTVMKDSGVAIMGSASAAGDDRASRAVMNALNSPLLNDNNIRGAKDILINIRYGENEVRMEEVSTISKYVQHEAGEAPNIILGVGPDTALKDEILVTVLATGFEQDQDEELSFTSGDKVLNPVQPPQGETPTINTNVNQGNPNYINHSQSQGGAQQSNTKYSQPVSPPKVNLNPPVQPEVFEVKLRDQIPENHQRPIVEEEQVEPKQNIELQRPVDQASEEPPINLNYTDGGRSFTDEPEEEEARLLRAALLRKNRKERLSQFSETNYEQADINEMEKQPAFKRKNGFRFVKVPDENVTNVSRYTLKKNSDEDIRLRKDNAFIHDNID